MTEYHYNNRRELVDKYGRKKKDDVMRDGESISVPLMFTDSAAPAHDIADDGQAAYEARVANAWKATPDDFATDTGLHDAGHYADANDDGQTAYEARINNAWKPTAADHPEAA